MKASDAMGVADHLRPVHTTRDWEEVLVPFTDFKPSGRLLRAVPGPRSLKSIAVVAFGRDHIAEIDVKEVGFY